MDTDFQEFIQKVKDANPIEDIIEATGAEFSLHRKRGIYLRGSVHDSLVIRTDEQYYVWNDRSEKGDVFNWLEARNKWDFWTSLQWLAERAKIEMPHRFQQQENQAARMSNRIREDVWGLAQHKMAEWLWKDEEVVNYVRSRGWNDEIIQSAGLGFSGRAAAAQVKDLRGDFSMHNIDPESPHAVAILGYRGNVKAWGKKWDIEVQENWIEWGLIPGLMGKTRLVYPHWFGGRVRYLTARNILGAEVNKEGREIKGFNLPVVLAGDRQPYYNHVYGRRAENCVVVEGQADAITLAQWDIPAMAIAGTSWQDHASTLEELRKRHQNLYIGLDKDDAGYQAIIGKDRDWPLAQVMGPMTRVVRWPGGQEAKDANDWLKAMKEEGVQGEEQADLAREALAAAATFAEEAARWAGQQQGADRDQAINLVFSLIARMPKVQRMQYRSKLCDRMNLSISEFNAILKVAGEVDEDDHPLEIIETLGGYIDGWLIEYIYDPEEDKARLAYRDPDGRIDVADSMDISGIRYIPRMVTSFIQDGGVLFPSKLGQLKDTRELVAIVESFIHRHYLLEDKYLGRIIAYYVLMTWVYDAFNALPYLRAMGEAGAGKSELMRRVGFLCYRMMTASGANTAASFFRATETYRGTVFIDEADLHDGGDMSNDLVKFLNLGAMKGNPIWRLEEVNTENGKSYEVATFSTFCPKLIAMRKDFRDDAVGTRALTIKLMPREPLELKAAGIRLYIDEEFRQKATAIRNLLLRWRLQMWEPEIEVNEEHLDLEISSRLNQVTMPLKALAKDDEELRGEIERFLRAYNRELVLTRSMTIDARIVEAMWKIYRYVDLRKLYLKATPEGKEYIMIGDVCKIANEIMDEMNRGDDAPEDEEEKPKYRKKDQLSPRGTGHIVRNNLQMHVGERKEFGYPVFWDEIKMQALAKRYGVDYESIPTNAKSTGGKESPKQEEIPF